MNQAIVVGLTVMGLVMGGCAKRSKVELEYEPPVTNVWTGGQGRGELPPPPPAPPPRTLPPPSPPQASPPPAQVPVDARVPPPAPSAPARWPAPDPGYPVDADGTLPPEAYPEERPQAQGSTLPSPHHKAQPVVITDPATGATTVVVPDQGPTTATTLRRKTGWVRGGYD
jgi:hypothetical protein